jgi:hypothetical protein
MEVTEMFCHKEKFSVSDGKWPSAH